jgi:hypothetical protein
MFLHVDGREKEDKKQKYIYVWCGGGGRGKFDSKLHSSP